MTKNILKINSDNTVLEACKQYLKHKVGSLVVMNNDLIVGILTERDIIESIILVNGDPKHTYVRDIMSPNLKTIHALATVEKAANIMKENNIKKLPVVLNNEIVGIITETDLSRTITAYAQSIDELTNFYYESREQLEQLIDDWGNIIVGLKSFKKLENNTKKPVEDEIELDA